MLQINQTAYFKRVYKKLPKQSKSVLDTEIRVVMDNPEIGELKKGDLDGIRVHKFKINKQLVLLAYIFANRAILLMDFGPHENFYRDLKKRNL